MNYYQMVKQIILEFESLFTKISAGEKEPFPKELWYWELTKRFGVQDKFLDNMAKKMMPKYNIKLNSEDCFENKNVPKQTPASQTD